MLNKINIIDMECLYLIYTKSLHLITKLKRHEEISTPVFAVIISNTFFSG